MTAPLLRRAYVRALRGLGLKQRSWDAQFAAAVACYGPRSPHTVERVAALCRGGRLLEFGCGEGELPLVLPPGSFSSYLGFDISAIAIGRARQRASSAGLRQVDFERADMATWDRPERADLILAEECVYYLSVPQLETFLDRCMRCLAPGRAMLVILHSATKHPEKLEVCRSRCAVRDESLIGTRTYLTLAAPPGDRQALSAPAGRWGAA